MAKAESKKAARQGEASGGSLMDTTDTGERVRESDGLIRGEPRGIAPPARRRQGSGRQSVPPTRERERERESVDLI